MANSVIEARNSNEGVGLYDCIGPIREYQTEDVRIKREMLTKLWTRRESELCMSI